MENVDLERLGAHLATIGWDIKRMSATIGMPVEAEMSREKKLLMRDIVAMNDVRFIFDVYKRCFPEATITEIQHRRQP